MNPPDELATAKLVQVHKARDEMEGNFLVGHLQDNGIEAVMRSPPSVPPYDIAEWMYRNNKIDAIFVREPDAVRARRLIQEFLTTAADAPSLEALAAQRPPLTKEKIGQLRVAVREERRTFWFLGGLAVAFVGVVLAWRSALSYSRWTLLAALLLAAVAMACWARPQR